MATRRAVAPTSMEPPVRSAPDPLRYHCSAHPGPRPCRPGASRRPKSLQAILCWPILGLGLAGPALRAVQNRSRRFCAGPSWASALQARRFAPSKIAPGDFVLAHPGPRPCRPCGHWQRNGRQRYSARPDPHHPKGFPHMGDFTTLMARDGHEFQAYLAAPPARPRGAVVVIQEIFGINGHIRAVTDGFAAEGYTAIAPALFDRIRRGIELGYDSSGSDEG